MTRQPRTIEIRGDVAVIPLTRGKFAMIDVADVPLVENHQWRLLPRGKVVYAATTVTIDGRKTTLGLHQVICGVRGPLIDHVDRNGLNCRRKNLRLASPSQNMMNRGAPSNNASGVKGVSWNKRDRRWDASIRVDGKLIHLGYFKTLDEAEAARIAGEAEHYGEYSPRYSSLG